MISPVRSVFNLFCRQVQPYYTLFGLTNGVTRLLFHPDVPQPPGHFILRIFYVAAPDSKPLKDG